MQIKFNECGIVEAGAEHISRFSDYLAKNSSEFIPVFGSGITAALTGCNSSLELIKGLAKISGIKSWETEDFHGSFIDVFAQLIELRSKAYAAGNTRGEAYIAFKADLRDVYLVNGSESKMHSILSRLSHLLPYMCSACGKCIIMSIDMTCNDMQDLLLINDFHNSAECITVDTDVQEAKEKASVNKDRVYFQILFPLLSKRPGSDYCDCDFASFEETKDFFSAHFGTHSLQGDSDNQSEANHHSFLFVGMSEDEKAYFLSATGVEERVCHAVDLCLHNNDDMPDNADTVELKAFVPVRGYVKKLMLTCDQERSSDELLNLLEMIYADYCHPQKPGIIDGCRVEINNRDFYFGVERLSGDCGCEYRDESINSVYVSDRDLSGSSSTSYINVFSDRSTPCDYTSFVDRLLFSDEKLITEMVYGKRGLGKSRLAFNLFESICKDDSALGQWSIFYFGCPAILNANSFDHADDSKSRTGLARKALIIIDNIPICSSSIGISACASPLYVNDHNGQSVWVGLDCIMNALKKYVALDNGAIIRVMLMLNGTPENPGKLMDVSPDCWITPSIKNTFSVPSDFWTEERLMLLADDYIVNLLRESIRRISIREDVEIKIKRKELTLPGAVLGFISEEHQDQTSRAPLEEIFRAAVRVVDIMKERDINDGLIMSSGGFQPDSLSEKIMRINYSLPIGGRDYDRGISHENHSNTHEGNEYYDDPRYDHDEHDLSNVNDDRGFSD